MKLVDLNLESFSVKKEVKVVKVKEVKAKRSKSTGFEQKKRNTS